MQSFVLDNAATFVQRLYRGHLGRRKYKLRYDVVWAQKAEKWALVLQAGYRGMKGEFTHGSLYLQPHKLPIHVSLPTEHRCCSNMRHLHIVSAPTLFPAVWMI